MTWLLPESQTRSGSPITVTNEQTLTTVFTGVAKSTKKCFRHLSLLTSIRKISTFEFYTKTDSILTKQTSVSLNVTSEDTLWLWFIWPCSYQNVWQDNTLSVSEFKLSLCLDLGGILVEHILLSIVKKLYFYSYEH